MRKRKSDAEKRSIRQEDNVAEKDLVDAIRAVQDGIVAKDRLYKVFSQLADNILKFVDLEMPEGSQKGAAELCLEKMDRFNCEKGKAFSFFTTIILCYYRQIYRANKNLNELLRKAG